MHVIVTSASSDDGLIHCVSVADASKGNLSDDLRMKLIDAGSEKVVVRAEGDLVNEVKAQFG